MISKGMWMSRQLSRVNISCATTEVLKVPNACAIDQILYQLALSTMSGGHRYGAFLDAAVTAAKCAVYTTYIEQGRNFRRTGLLHHVEPKRVKEIVQEVQSALTESKLLKTLASEEPKYLIGLPHLWMKKYSWEPGQSRILSSEFSNAEKARIEKMLSPGLPKACLLNLLQFKELIQLLDLEANGYSRDRQYPLSEALEEHIKLRLIESGTVIQIEPHSGSLLYALARTTYSPKDRRERVYSMLEDVADFFKLMQSWVEEENEVLRGLETFDIAPERKQEALQELDSMLQSWADKYHQEGGDAMVLHLVVGPRENSPETSMFSRPSQ